MIYSLSAYKDIITNNTKSVDNSVVIEDNLFSFGLECIEESDNELNDIMSRVVIKESLGSSFIDIIKTIIVSFINLINRIFDKFKQFFLYLLRSDKSIENYKSKLLKFDESFEIFDYDLRYRIYTNFEADIPDPNLYLRFSEDYEESVGKLEKYANSLSKQELLSKIDHLTDSIDLDIDGKYFSTLRSSILKSKDIVRSEEYPDKLYKIFRNDDDIDNPVTDTRRDKFKITPLMVRSACKRYYNIKKMIKETEKQKATLVNTANSVVKKFEKLDPSIVYTNYNTLDYDLANVFERYGRKKASQLSETCNICVMAFTAKLDALKEASAQDKKICFYAISRMISGGIV